MPANHRHFLELPNGMLLEIRGLQARNAETAKQITTKVVVKSRDNPSTVYTISKDAAVDLLDANLVAIAAARNSGK